MKTESIRNRMIRNLKKKTAMLLLLVSTVCSAILPQTAMIAEAAAKTPASIYLQQQKSDTCTLASATMMIRSRMYLSGDANWSKVTESALRSKAWTSDGLRWNFSYSVGGSNVSVAEGSFVSGNQSTCTLQKLKNLLDKHPEGIVLYAYVKGTKKQHAVFLTDYEGNTLYCADPASGYAGKRIPLGSSYLKKYFGNQDGIIRNTRMYWYVSSYKKGSAATTNNKNNGTGGIQTPLKIVLTQYTCPTTVNKGKVFYLKGNLSATRKMSQVTAGVYTASSGGTCKTGKTVTVNATSYNIKNIDRYVEFNKLARGTYYYRITVKVEGKTYTVLNKKFTVR